MIAFSWMRFGHALLTILPYLRVTFQIVVVAVAGGTLLGLLVAMLRLKHLPVLDQALLVYISFMRGTPMIVQLMLVYYGFPALFEALFGTEATFMTKIIAVDLAFILNEGAFLGEIFRGAIEAVPVVQTEAALATGMTRSRAFVRIVLPQAARFALPNYGFDIVGIFHNTSLAYLLGVMDVIGYAKTLGTLSLHYLEPYLVVALLYIVISLALDLLFKGVDRKLVFGRAVST